MGKRRRGGRRAGSRSARVRGRSICLTVVTALIGCVALSGCVQQAIQQDDTGCSPDSLVGSNAVEQAYNFFLQAGLKDFQAAGVVGNLYEESEGVNPEALQNTPRGTKTSSEQEVNNSDPNIGWGLVQWSPPSKMIRPARAAGHSYDEINSLQYQLEVILAEISKPGGKDGISDPAGSGSPNLWAQLKASTSIEDSTTKFESVFERAGTAALSTRITDAKGVLKDYGGNGGGGGGGNGGGDGGGDQANIGSCDSGGVDGYVRPLNPDQWIPARTDQGIDYQPKAPAPIYAIGDAKILDGGSGAGWPGGMFMDYVLLSGPMKGKCIYVAEHITDTPKAGTVVKAGQKIATGLPGDPWLEMGWRGTNWQDPSVRYNGAADGTPMDGGKAFTRFMEQLKLPTQQHFPNGPLYAGTSCNAS